MNWLGHFQELDRLNEIESENLKKPAQEEDKRIFVLKQKTKDGWIVTELGDLKW